MPPHLQMHVAHVTHSTLQLTPCHRPAACLQQGLRRADRGARSTPQACLGHALPPGFCCDKEPGWHEREMTPVLRFDQLLDFDDDCMDMGAPVLARADSYRILTHLDM